MFGFFSLYIHIYNLWSVYMVRLFFFILRPRMVLKLITYEYNLDLNFYSSGYNPSPIILFFLSTEGER
jgi:hypothetical protein